MRIEFLGVCGGLLVAGAALGAEDARTGSAAYGDWHTDAPGVRRLIRPADLPTPYATLSAANPSRLSARAASQVPKAPPGFVVDLFADGLATPRVIRTAPNGDVFVAETGAGRVLVFPAGLSGATPARGEVFAGGIERPFESPSIHPGPILVSSMSRRPALSCAFLTAAARPRLRGRPSRS